MARYSTPALAPLAPKRKQGHCARWRPPGLDHHGSRHKGPRKVCLALISPPLVSLPGEAAFEEVLRRPPRKAWPLARVLNALSMKMGHTDLLAQPRRGTRVGKSGHPRSQNADNIVR